MEANDRWGAGDHGTDDGRLASGDHPLKTEPRSGDIKIPGWVILAVSCLLVLWIGSHVVTALASHPHPPDLCYLLGGRWDIWNGWRCG